jgi:hypothetical protein
MKYEARDLRAPRRFGAARRSGVRAREPVEQTRGGLVRRCPVKGHQRGRHAGNPDDVGAPALVGRHHLDEVRATTDGLFKAMNSRLHSRWTDLGCLRERDELSCPGAAQTSEAPYETASTIPPRADRGGKLRKFFLVSASSTGYARGVHRFSTA